MFAICRVLQVIFEPRVKELKKKTPESQATENLLELWQTKKNEEVFPHN